MTAIITHATGTILPTLVDGFESIRESRTIIHDIIGRPSPDITIRPAGLRTGTLRLIFADTAASESLLIVDGIVQALSTPAQYGETASLEAEQAHAAGGLFTFTATGRPSLTFSYVPSGEITRELDLETRSLWVLSIDFQEVTV